MICRDCQERPRMRDDVTWCGKVDRLGLLRADDGRDCETMAQARSSQ